MEEKGINPQRLFEDPKKEEITEGGDLDKERGYKIPGDYRVTCWFWEQGKEINTPAPSITLDNDKPIFFKPPDKKEDYIPVRVERIERKLDDKDGFKKEDSLILDFKKDLKISKFQEIYIKVDEDIKSHLEEIKEIKKKSIHDINQDEEVEKAEEGKRVRKKEWLPYKDEEIPIGHKKNS